MYTLVFLGISAIAAISLYAAYAITKGLLTLYKIGFTWLISKTSHLLDTYNSDHSTFTYFN